MEAPIGPSIERSLVDRARLGDLEAFEELVRTRMDAVYRLALAITGSEADARDAAQQTFVAAWRSLRALKDGARFDAWLRRIAVNEGRMAVRARSRRRLRELPSSALMSVGEPMSRDLDDGARLGLALERLTPDQRAILALHHLDGRSVAEVAEVLAIPVGTAKSRLFAARRALQAGLQLGDE